MRAIICRHGRGKHQGFAQVRACFQGESIYNFNLAGGICKPVEVNPSELLAQADPEAFALFRESYGGWMRGRR